MTPRSSQHEPVNFMPELICDAIPAPSLARPKDAGSDKNGEKPQNPPAGPEDPKADDPQGGPPSPHSE